MGLFDKKYCSICGEKIGLLGNRKLEDGNLCKTCAAKLSPWFDERRHSTVEDIRGQLDYRVANLDKVRAFRTTSTYGQSMLLCLDENQQQFMVCKTKNTETENPDVLSFADVTGCDIDIEENRTELKREVKNANGTTNRVSYVPPRYTYDYNFWVRIRVNHPYFGEIRFRLNRNSISYDPQRMGGGVTSAGAGISRIMGAFNPGMQQGGQDPRMMIPDYAECVRMGEEIKKALTDIHTQVRDDYAAANAPKMAVQCPYCGATTTPDASGRCEYCGGALT